MSLTQKERHFCEMLRHNPDLYLVRDRMGSLSLVVKTGIKPKRDTVVGTWTGKQQFICLDDSFDFITWESGKPWSIKELLALEVVA